ncbi:hypothetical protein J0S82_000830 [Galemys pyrenaicus]|uniref:Uncharacterized protein n=1 Tax=Galemys pyrenaicus TaxID=202257 RepID=A0A8J6DEV6_GALPY|nr:hypothetical protein J0S82_000830 [Galemys pyrenaicus]
MGVGSENDQVFPPSHHCDDGHVRCCEHSRVGMRKMKSLRQRRRRLLLDLDFDSLKPEVAPVGSAGVTHSPKSQENTSKLFYSLIVLMEKNLNVPSSGIHSVRLLEVHRLGWTKMVAEDVVGTLVELQLESAPRTGKLSGLGPSSGPCVSQHLLPFPLFQREAGEMLDSCLGLCSLEVVMVGSRHLVAVLLASPRTVSLCQNLPTKGAMKVGEQTAFLSSHRGLRDPVAIISGGKDRFLWKQGRNRKKSPSPHRKTKVVSVTQQLQLELSQQDKMLFRDKR